MKGYSSTAQPVALGYSFLLSIQGWFSLVKIKGKSRD